MSEFTKENPGEELRQKGNEAFGKQDFGEAERLYTQAIELVPSSLSFGNRSAARLSLGKNEEALADALEALRIDSSYMKGYHRQACALKAMGNLEGVYEAYRAAFQTDSSNDWAKTQYKQAKKEYTTFLREEPVSTIEQWVKLFGMLEDPRERMMQLALFWNASSPAERQSIFHRFLAIISGAAMTDAVAKEEFTEDKMVELPMDNYEDMQKTDAWVDFYTSQDSAAKLDVFEKTWDATTDQEKNIIINDLKHFFLVPVLREKGLIG
uniref:Uncharacterized protein n=1 Tax=Heterosigma akashiwo TaxID=2829 RepID=A0A6V1NCR2_HETAK